MQTMLHHHRLCRRRGVFRRQAFPVSRCGRQELIRESDDIYLKFGADQNVYGIDKQKEIEEIRRKAITANLKLIECPIRHLGTEEGYKIYTRLQEHLIEQGVHMLFNTMVDDIIIENGVAKAVVTDSKETYSAGEIIAAIGR